MIAVYPGSFDPMTYGHLDIIRRGARLCDKLIVAVLRNVEKKALFSSAERVEILKKMTEDLPNVEVTEYFGLTVDLCRAVQADAMIRGIRGSVDFDSEYQLSQANRALEPSVETLLLITDCDLCFVSSSSAKEIAAFGGDLSKFLPPYVESKVKEKYREIKQ